MRDVSVMAAEAGQVQRLPARGKAAQVPWGSGLRGAVVAYLQIGDIKGEQREEGPGGLGRENAGSA